MRRKKKDVQYEIGPLGKKVKEMISLVDEGWRCSSVLE